MLKNSERQDLSLCLFSLDLDDSLLSLNYLCLDDPYLDEPLYRIFD